MKNVSGKTAVITGGASGIGFGMAQVFAEAGMNLVLLDVEASALDGAAEKLRATGTKVETIVADVTDRDGMANAAQKATQAFGAVHLLCNNAGVNAMGPFEELSYQDWDWVMGVNVNGVVNGVVSFLPELKKHGTDAHIVNTASVGGLLGMPNLTIYNASKFAVVGFSEALRADLKESGVGVSVLCPGVVKSNLATSARNRPSGLKNNADDPVVPDAAAAGIEMGTDPIDLGRHVLQSVQDGEFFICTHPEFQGALKIRHDAIDGSFRGKADPAALEAVSGMVLPF